MSLQSTLRLVIQTMIVFLCAYLFAPMTAAPWIAGIYIIVIRVLVPNILGLLLIMGLLGA